MRYSLLLLVPLLSTVETATEFPRDFIFGVASSAYQIEGGHVAGGKGESIWDHHLRLNPDLVVDKTNGNIACDSYNKFEEDVALLAELGVDFYRFSISWPRILPDGYSNRINAKGVRYYNALIDAMVAKGVEPMVTMYHWDLPQKLQELGGWTNPMMAEYFEDYARVLLENFGDRVKLWITFNVGAMGYGDGVWPPHINHPGIAEYLYAKTILLAHARAFRMYRKKFDGAKGKMGITVDARWYQPNSDKDRAAAERARQFNIGLYLHPIIKGDFPEIVKQLVGESSKTGGFHRSRLPNLTEAEIDDIRGCYDFVGLNVYTSHLVKDGAEIGSPDEDVNATIFQDDKWPKSESSWLRVTPFGLRKVLSWVKETYGNPLVYLTENGFSDKGQLDDTARIDFFKTHLAVLLDAIHLDGVNVKAFTAWSLLDNFEWLSGYTEKFGLYSVDFNDPSRPRKAKSSAVWYRSLITRRNLSRSDDDNRTNSNVSGRIDGDL